MQENNKDPRDYKRLPIWLQLTICTAILIGLVYLGITTIGKEEYNKQFCEKMYEPNDYEVAVLIEDTKNMAFGESEAVRLWGCCLFSLNEEERLRLTFQDNCKYTPEYEEPKLKDKYEYFLKRFK